MVGRAKPERTRQGPAAASTAAPALASRRGAGPGRGRGGVEVGQPQSAYQPVRASAEARPGALPAVAQAAFPGLKWRRCESLRSPPLPRPDRTLPPPTLPD